MNRRSSELAALLASAAAFAGDIRARDPEFDFRIPSSSSSAAAVDLAAHHLVLDARDRQRILETLDTTVRVQRTTEALALQHAALHEARARPDELAMAVRKFVARIDKNDLPRGRCGASSTRRSTCSSSI